MPTFAVLAAMLVAGQLEHQGTPCVGMEVLLPPQAMRLAMRATVDYGTQPAQTIAPELSVTTPDGRRVGFDHESGGDRTEVPGASYAREGSSEDADDPSDTGGPRDLQLPQATDGTYVLEVIATTPGRYFLDVVGALEGSGARTSTSRRIRDVPMNAGEVHRYRVRLGREDDGAVRLLVAREGGDARPGRRRAPLAPALYVSLGAACSGGSLPSLRMTLPDGRIVSRGAPFADVGPPHGVDLQKVEDDGGKHDRHVHIENPRDGEYVLEIAVADGGVPYFLHAELDAGAVGSDVWPWEWQDCARRVIAPGTVHRWTFRLRRADDAPLRVAERPKPTSPPRRSPAPCP